MSDLHLADCTVPKMPCSRDLSKPTSRHNTHTCLPQEHQTVVLIQLHIVGLCVCVYVCVCVREREREREGG